MTLTQQPQSTRKPSPSPLVAGAFGLVVFALSVISGSVFEVNADSRLGHDHSLWEATSNSAAEFGIALVGLAIAAWVGQRALSGPPSRVAKTALALALVAAATMPAFWAGWPNIFGAVAVALALETRRRLGSVGPMTGIAAGLGTLAFVAGSAISVLG